MLYPFLALLCSLLITLPLSSQEEENSDHLCLSTPDQIAALSTESSHLIGGLISPLSGQIVLRQTDLIVKGAQNLNLSRIYIPPHMPASFPQHKNQKENYDNRYLYHHLKDNYQGWQFYPHARLGFHFKSRTARVTEPNGMTLDFQLSGPNDATTTCITAPSP